MNRQQIIKAVTEKTGISRKDTAKVFSSIFETILKSLEKEESVRLMNFGSFTVKTYKPRKGYNPASKIVVQLPERKAIRFKLAKRHKTKGSVVILPSKNVYFPVPRCQHTPIIP